VKLNFVVMTGSANSDSFVFKYFLSCCAATISESGKFTSAVKII